MTFFSEVQKKKIEIISHGGQWLLDCESANYSYGSLQKAFEDAFFQIQLQDLPLKNILMLGLGGGCVLKVLRDTYHIQSPITVVEFDPLMVEIAEKYYNIRNIPQLLILLDDAWHYCQNSNEHYDFVIVDIFIDLQVPEIFLTETFARNLARILLKDGFLLFNLVTSQSFDKDAFFQQYQRNYSQVLWLEPFKNQNQMLFAKR